MIGNCYHCTFSHDPHYQFQNKFVRTYTWTRLTWKAYIHSHLTRCSYWSIHSDFLSSIWSHSHIDGTFPWASLNTDILNGISQTCQREGLEKCVSLRKDTKKCSLAFNLHREDPQVSELLLVVLGKQSKSLSSVPRNVECHPYTIPRLHVVWLNSLRTWKCAMSVSSNYIEEENSAYTRKIFPWMKLFLF